MPRPAPPSARALLALSQLHSLGSLTGAAERLGVTRSALSHRIAELEKSLGIALTRKAGRKLVLTEDGERLLASMGDALERIEAAVEPLRRHRGQIRLSTVSTFASLWLIPRLPDFQARRPGVEVAISTTTRAVDLSSEDVDCAIRHGRGEWKDVISILLFAETLMPVAAPVVAGRARANTGRGWRGIPLIRARSRFMDWTRWQKAAPLSANGSPKWLTVETRAQALDAAIAGAGIALMDMAYIGPPVASGRLMMLADHPLRLPTGYYFVYRPGVRNLRLLTDFRDFVVEAAGPFRAAAAVTKS
ncbi:LysR substrate-binding domain-containing protein [Bradyrhizobium sp. ARR65]|uniref:LysR substrate-binding domain-containing protein n=1 Tax=Bradyrhizobium sp. ARR65 TaxID=1040989 RepID=UPI00055925C2|nr:LysR substrate-binding domain-containing protein [Bradyrhizobium sp. ARR65]